MDNSPKRILALDPANRCGFAHSNGRRGVWELKRKTDKHPGARLVRFYKHLTAAVQAWGCDLIASEDASMGSRHENVKAMHNELRGIIHLVAAKHGCEVKLFSPGQIKSHACDDGFAEKHQMIAAVKRHFGIVTQDNDEADAIWVLDLAKRPDCWARQVSKKWRGFKGHRRNGKPQKTLF
jgi:Holliday junction resolvasome RuvABC endonuclease subunit